MSVRDYYALARLPERPDPDSGEPAPPEGLGFLARIPARPEEDTHREIRLSHKPDPPPGRGPVLSLAP